jgi:hypothetical protein
MYEVLQEVLAEHFEVHNESVRFLSNDIHSDGPIYGFEILGLQEATFVYAQVANAQWIDTEFQMHLPEVGIWVRLWRFPNDPYLQGLSLVAVKPALLSLLKKLDPRFEVEDVKNVTYRPGKRAVFRITTNLGDFFAKVTTKSNAARILEIQKVIQARISTAELVGMANGDVLIFKELSGDDFLHSDVSMEDIVSGIHRFHQSLQDVSIDIEAKRKVTSNPEWYVSLLESRFDAQALGVIEKSIGAALQFPADSEKQFIHGDFHLGQLKFQLSSGFSVLDFDNGGLGFLAEDQSALFASCFFGMVINQGNSACQKYAEFLHVWLSSLEGQEDLTLMRQLTARHIVAFLASFPSQVHSNEPVFLEFLHILSQEDENFLILTSSLLHPYRA